MIEFHNPFNNAWAGAQEKVWLDDEEMFVPYSAKCAPLRIEFYQ